MNDLIEALRVFQKYQDEQGKKYPTNCIHDVLCIMGVPKFFPESTRVKELDFEWSDEYDCWCSYRFGSA